jgi:hypothetical protein
MARGIIGENTNTTSIESVYNNISRYEVMSVTGEEVWAVSSSTVYVKLTWGRVGTSMTINRIAHGHSIGNRVIIRNTNVDYQSVTINSITTDSFTVTTTNTGITSGDDCAYSLGFTFVHIDNPKTGGILYAPTGSHADCQLLTLRIRTGIRQSTTYDIVVPASSINGAGDNTNLSNCFIPDYTVRADADNLSACPATIVTGSFTGGSYTTFKIGNLGTCSKIIILHF